MMNFLLKIYFLISGIVIEEPYAGKPYARFREGCGLTQLHYRDTEKEART